MSSSRAEEPLLDASIYYSLYPDDPSRGLQEAIDIIACNGGGTLYFPPGFYQINRGLVLYSKIRIIGAGRDVSVIEADPQQVTSIIGCQVVDRYPGPEALLHETRSLAAVGRGDNEILVANSFGFSPGKTVVIISENEIWPYAPLDYVHPGEMNEVIAVAGDRIIFKYPFYDSYPSGLLIRLYDYWPIEIRDLTLRFAYFSDGTQCLTLANAWEPVVENVAFANSGFAAIWAVLCRGGSLIHNKIENVTFPGSGTGYGIHTYGCLGMRIANNSINLARRGVDLSGVIPSRQIVVENNTVSVPTDRSYRASGMGTHGSAEDCVFRNNTITGGLISFLLRGKNLDVEDNIANGAIDHGVCSTAGLGHFVRDNEFVLAANGYSGAHLSPGISSEGLFCYIGNRLEARNGFSANTLTSNLVLARNTIAAKEFLVRVGNGQVVSPIVLRENTAKDSTAVFGSLLPDASLIIDNDAAMSTGQWFPSTSVPGYQGADYWHDGNANKGQKRVRFSFTVAWTGAYTVEMSFTAYHNRAHAVMVVIHHANGEDTVYVDQTKSPSTPPFLKLGVFSFAVDEPAWIEVSNAGTDGFVVADAVRVMPRPVPETIVLDALQAQRQGSWYRSSSVEGFVNQCYLHDNNQGKGNKLIQFDFPLEWSGLYDIGLSYTAYANRATNVPVVLRLATGEEVFCIDQTRVPTQAPYQMLGPFRLSTSSPGRLTIETQDTNGYVIANTVKLVPRVR